VRTKSLLGLSKRLNAGGKVPLASMTRRQGTIGKLARLPNKGQKKGKRGEGGPRKINFCKAVLEGAGLTGPKARRLGGYTYCSGEGGGKRWGHGHDLGKTHSRCRGKLVTL